MKPLRGWYVYVLECRDGSLYTGITVDTERRFRQHLAGTAARYTRAHPPVRLLGWQPFPDRSQASQAEYRVKRMSPARKRAWCLPDAVASEQQAVLSGAA